MILSLIIKSIFYFPGTFLHELSHYVAALLVGKPERFSIIPRREGNALVFGRVNASVRYKVLSVFISAAPLIWWIAFIFLLEHLQIISISARAPYINISLSKEMFKAFSLQTVFYLWIAIQFLWAGRLSIQDIKTLFGGVFSISGMFTILLIILGYQFRTLFI